jgi:hypothetical protein
MQVARKIASCNRTLLFVSKVHFLDVLASEGLEAQKTFDKQYGSGKAVFVKCDVSKKDELRGKHNGIFVQHFSCRILYAIVWSCMAIDQSSCVFYYTLFIM